jgi:protocatechuate 3,4-dioxygenase beta subunit
MLLLPITPNAQNADAPRSKALGVVRDHDGRPVADARVELWSWPVPRRIDVGSADHVVVPTGADGRFVAAILDGRTYSAAATWPGTGGPQRSELANDVVAGVVVALRAAEPSREREVVLRSDAEWSRSGPLRLTAVVGLQQPWVVPIALDAYGRGTVPATLPAAPTWLDVRTADGRLLLTRPLPDAAATANQRLQLDVPDPLAFRVRVVDEHDQPIAGAAVWQLHDEAVTAQPPTARFLTPDLSGRTAADGTLFVRLPAEHPVPQRFARIILLVVASGREPQITDAHLQRVAADTGITVRMLPGNDMTGRLLGAGGAPVARGVVPLLETFARVGRSGFVEVPALPVALDADGTLRAHGLHHQVTSRLFLAMEPGAALAAGMPIAADCAFPPLVAVAQVPSGRKAALGEVRLDQMQLVRVAVADHAGMPVAGARIRLVLDRATNTPLDFVADRVGRLQFPLGDGTWQLGAWQPGGGIATRGLAVPTDLAADGRRLELRLSPTFVISGKVDAAAAGGALECGDIVAVAGEEDLARSLALAMVTAPIATDGTFRLAVPFGNARYTLRARGAGPLATTPRGADLVVAVDDADIADVVVPPPPEK